MTTINTQLPAMAPAFGVKAKQSTEADVPLWTAAILWAHQDHDGDDQPSKQAESGKGNPLPSSPPLIEHLPFGVKNLADTCSQNMHLASVNRAYFAGDGTHAVLTVAQDTLQNNDPSQQNLLLHACGTGESLHVDVMEMQFAGYQVRMTIETSDHGQVIRTEKLNSIASQLHSSNQVNTALAVDGNVTTHYVTSVDCPALTSQAALPPSPLNVHVEWHKDELKIWIGCNQQDAKILAVAEQLLRWMALHFPLTSAVFNGKEVSLDGGDLSRHLNQDYTKTLQHTLTPYLPETQNTFSFQFGTFYVD